MSTKTNKHTDEPKRAKSANYLVELNIKCDTAESGHRRFTKEVQAINMTDAIAYVCRHYDVEEITRITLLRQC